ncbi:MAG: hypothetical protein ACRCTB_08715 [Vibrio sp.]
MNKLRLVSFLFASLALKSYAFSGGTFISSSALDAGNAHKKILANAPYSLCLLEGMNAETCDNYSLKIGGENYNKWVPTIIEMTKEEAWDLDTNKIPVFLTNYKIGQEINRWWQLPTAGQLAALINKGVINPQYGQKFHVRGGPSNIVQYGVNKNPSTQKYATIERLVANSYGGEYNSNIIPYRDFRVTAWANIPAGVEWNVKYLLKDGKEVKYHSNYRNFDITLPKGSYRIMAQACTISLCSGWANASPPSMNQTVIEFGGHGSLLNPYVSTSYY